MNITMGEERVALVGVNASGKSTFIQGLLGRLRHHGELRINSTAVRHVPADMTGYLPQNPDMPPLLRVEEAVRVAADLKQVPQDQLPASVEEALRAVDLTQESRTRVGRLSGGQVRRLGFAQAIVHRPQVLLLDEPTAGLDPVQRQRVRDVLHGLPTTGLTVVTSHILEDVAHWATRFLLLDGGRLVRDISAGEIDATDRAAALSEILFSTGTHA